MAQRRDAEQLRLIRMNFDEHRAAVGRTVNFETHDIWCARKRMVEPECVRVAVNNEDRPGKRCGVRAQRVAERIESGRRPFWRVPLRIGVRKQHNAGCVLCIGSFKRGGEPCGVVSLTCEMFGDRVRVLAEIIVRACHVECRKHDATLEPARILATTFLLRERKRLAANASAIRGEGTDDGSLPFSRIMAPGIIAPAVRPLIVAGRVHQGGCVLIKNSAHFGYELVRTITVAAFDVADEHTEVWVQSIYLSDQLPIRSASGS